MIESKDNIENILWEVIVYSARVSSDKLLKTDQVLSESLRTAEGKWENNLVRLMVVSSVSQCIAL